MACNIMASTGRKGARKCIVDEHEEGTEGGMVAKIIVLQNCTAERVMETSNPDLIKKKMSWNGIYEQ